MSITLTKSNSETSILVWLILLTLLVLVMIIIGGLTRLTESGLSIVDWKPIMGTVPPLSNSLWVEVFNKYKLSPEFKVINPSMTLNEFQYIFWWEWFHRFFARCLGIFFILPFIYFLFKKKLSNDIILTLIIVFVFGLIQAVVGWWMVKSGLVDDPYVSAYRLSFHLSIALIIFSILLWLSLSMYFGKEKNNNKSIIVKHLYHISLMLIFLTIISGGFMAGTDSGKAFNTFPLMNEQFIPDGYYFNEYGWKNIFENTIAINFNHRWLAMFTFLFISSLIFSLIGKDDYDKLSLLLVLIILFIQILLGILTLIYAVPLKFAILHQTNATLLLASMILAYHRLIYK